MGGIFFGGRHYIGNKNGLDHFTDVILPRTVNASKEFYASHLLRVNLPVISSDTVHLYEGMEKIKNSTPEVEIEYQSTGPGTSFRKILLSRQGDFSVVYGAEDMDINVIQDEMNHMARIMEDENIALGEGCRPQVKLDAIPEADLMRQIHEIYHGIAAGCDDKGTFPIENPFKHDLSKGSSLFVGHNGQGGFGDLTSGLCMLNHNAKDADFFCESLSLAGLVAESDFFTGEYASHIKLGIKNMFRTYTSYTENRVEETEEFSDEQRINRMQQMDKFIVNYSRNLAKVIGASHKLIEAVENLESTQAIKRNLQSWQGRTKIATPREITDRVLEDMQEGLFIGRSYYPIRLNYLLSDGVIDDVGRTETEEEANHVVRILNKQFCGRAFVGPQVNQD